MQHDKYIKSGRSLAAHLTGVGIAVEHGVDERLLRSVQQWLSRTRELERPAVPASRGDVTIDDVIRALPEDRHAVVGRWSAAVWAAWSDDQQIARTWIRRPSPRS